MTTHTLAQPTWWAELMEDHHQTLEGAAVTFTTEGPPVTYEYPDHGVTIEAVAGDLLAGAHPLIGEDLETDDRTYHVHAVDLTVNVLAFRRDPLVLTWIETNHWWLHTPTNATKGENP